MEKLIQIFAIMLITTPLAGQSLEREVIGSGGSYMEQSGMSISATIGEAVDDNYITGTLTLLQGFQQPADIVEQTNIEEVTVSVDYKVYPNPVRDQLNVEYQTQEKVNLYIELVNTTGKVLIKEKRSISNSGQFSINVASLTNGVYYLVFRQGNGSIAESIPIRKR